MLMCSSLILDITDLAFLGHLQANPRGNLRQVGMRGEILVKPGMICLRTGNASSSLVALSDALINAPPHTFMSFVSELVGHSQGLHGRAEKIRKYTGTTGRWTWEQVGQLAS